MRENCMAGYLNSNERDPSLLLDALRYSSASGESNSANLTVLEELAISSASKNLRMSDSALAKIRILSNSKSDSAEIAQKKEARIRLHRALAFLQREEIDSAQKELNSVLSILQGLPEKSKKIFLIAQYFSCASTCARARGDRGAAAAFSSARDGLKDPVLAKQIYLKYKLPGFESDFSADYRALFYLAKYRRSSKQSERQIALTQMRPYLTDDGLSKSSKAALLLELAYHAANTQDLALENLLLAEWLKLKSPSAQASLEEIVSLSPLLDIAASTGNSAAGIDLLEHYVEAVELKKIRPEAWSVWFENLDVFCLQVKLFPIPEAYRERIDRICQRVQAIAFSDGKSCASIELIRLGLLEDKEKFADAEKEFLQKVLVDRQFERLMPAPARFLIFTSLIDRLSVGLQRNFGPESRRRFISAVLASNKLSKEVKANTAVLAAKMEHDYDAKSTSRTNEILLKYANDPSLKQQHYELEDTLLRFYCWAGDLSHGAEFYSRMKSELKAEPALLVSHCHSALSWLRAFPSYKPDWHQVCVEKKFPDAIFRDGFQLIKYLKNDKQRVEYTLWFAQYELCRGDKDGCIKLCDSILMNSENTKYSVYFPAKILREQLAGNNNLPQGKISCVKGTRDELACLWSLLFTAGYKLESDRVKNLTERIAE